MLILPLITAFIETEKISFHIISLTFSVFYDIIWQMFIQKSDDKNIIAYIRKNIIKMLRYAIDNKNVKAVSAVCERKDLLSKENADVMIEYAIKNGETIEIQSILMRYKKYSIGFGSPNFSI